MSAPPATGRQLEEAGQTRMFTAKSRLMLSLDDSRIFHVATRLGHFF
jgi:hypothetical protein